MAAAALVDTFREHKVPILTAQDGEFRPTLESFTFIHEDKIPGIVALPANDQQVAAVVSACIEAKQEMTVRGRGHDSHGRYSKEGSVCIDMRNLDTVTLSDDKKTATVGAGCSHLKVLDELMPHGLVAATGGCGDVGFCGWSMTGGYGPYSSLFGLGVDQIVGAKLVNPEGKLVDADEKLLKGIRGAGGMFGVVVSLTVKVYPLKEIQSGLIMFDNSDLVNNVTKFLTAFSALARQKGAIPRELIVSPGILPVPGIGVTLGVVFVWSGPADDAFRHWLDKIGSLATLLPGAPSLADSVKSSTPMGFLTFMTSLFPKQIHGNIQSVAFSHLSDEAIAAYTKQGVAQPADGCGGLLLHTVALESPSLNADVPDAVTPYRIPHFCVEVLGLAPTVECGQRMRKWAVESRMEMVKVDASIDSTYIPLTSPEFFDVRKIFGENYAELEKLKKEYDPKNVFANTHPRLAS